MLPERKLHGSCVRRRRQAPTLLPSTTIPLHRDLRYHTPDEPPSRSVLFNLHSLVALAVRNSLILIVDNFRYRSTDLLHDSSNNKTAAVFPTIFVSNGLSHAINAIDPTFRSFPILTWTGPASDSTITTTGMLYSLAPYDTKLTLLPP